MFTFCDILHEAKQKIGTQCVHVSAIWKFNNHMGNKATHASKRRTFALLGFTVDVGKPGVGVSFFHFLKVHMT